MKVAALISTGKDSVLAMHRAKEAGHEIVCIISIFSSNPASYMFHIPNIALVKPQAECLGVPLIIVETAGEKEEELKELRAAMQEAKTKYHIDAVVSGAVQSKYQWERIDKLCGDLELRGLAPLWGIDQAELLEELLERKFDVIFSSIGCYGLTEKWLGRKLTREAIDELKQLRDKHGINIAGEGGEYESLVLDSPMFKKKLHIAKAHPEMEDENTGVYVVEQVAVVDK